MINGRLSKIPIALLFTLFFAIFLYGIILWFPTPYQIEMRSFRAFDDGSPHGIKRILLIGIDGIGILPQIAKTPNIERVIQNGIYTFNGTTVYPSYSLECWSSMLHAVDPALHKMSTTFFPPDQWDPNSPYPSVFKMILQARPNAEIGSFVNWDIINSLIIEKNLQMTKRNNQNDESVAMEAAEYVKDTNFTMVFVSFNDCDESGHKDGFYSENQIRTLESVDRYIGGIFSALNESGKDKDTMIILSTDHGGSGLRPASHGSNHPKDMTVYWAATGPNFPRHKELVAKYHTIDMTPTILYVLGISQHPLYTGKPLEDIVKMFPK